MMSGRHQLDFELIQHWPSGRTTHPFWCYHHAVSGETTARSHDFKKFSKAKWSLRAGRLRAKREQQQWHLVQAKPPPTPEDKLDNSQLSSEKKGFFIDGLPWAPIALPAAMVCTATFGPSQQHLQPEKPLHVRSHLAGSLRNRVQCVAIARTHSGKQDCRKRQKACVLCAASNGAEPAASVAATNGAVASLPQAQRPRPQYIPNRIDDPNYVRIFDTTLRDGEQSPGATLTSAEKLEIAKQLAKLRVDIIEAGEICRSCHTSSRRRSFCSQISKAYHSFAVPQYGPLQSSCMGIFAGFPVASPDDFDAVRRIAMDVGNARDPDGYVPVICGLSRTKLRQAALHQSPLNLVLACHRLLLNCFSTLANTPNWSPHACAVFPFSWPASFFPSCHLYALPRRQLRMQSILLYQQMV